MKTYRIVFEGGFFSTLFGLILFTFMCFSVIGLPLAIAILPTMYRIVEDSDMSVG
jgi:hypothetical protein